MDDAPTTQTETAQWIVGAVGKYADCANKHRLTVESVQGVSGE